jgi:hypothetical protein
VLLRSRKNQCSLRGAEGSSFAEYVHEARQFALRGRRYHSPADEVNVFPGASAKLRRNHMRPEEGGNYGPRPLPRGRSDGFERFQFSFKTEAVARLGLDGGGSVTRQLWSASKTFRASAALLAFRTPSMLERIPPPASAISS